MGYLIFVFYILGFILMDNVVIFNDLDLIFNI